MAAASLAVAQLRQADSDLRQAHRDTERERRAAAGGPEPPDAILSRLDALVGEHAARWRAQHAYHVVDSLSAGLETNSDGQTRTVRPKLPHFGHAPLTVLDLIGFAPELAKATLRQLVSTSDYRAGAPIAERQRLLDEIDARLEAIESQHEQLVDEAATAGIEMPYFARVQQRKDAEQARAAREAVERQQRADLEAAVEQAAKAAAAPRATRSAYVESSGATMRSKPEV